MRFLTVIVICEIAALAFMAAGFNPPANTGDVFTSWALAGHMAAALSCLCLACFDLARALKREG